MSQGLPRNLFIMKKNKGYSKKKKREVEQKVRDLIGRNFSDHKIGMILGLQPHVVRHYKQLIFNKDKRTFATMTTEDWLAYYAQSVESLQTELDEALSLMKGQKPTKAEVAALRLKHRLENSVVQQAQSMGKLPKRGRELSIGDKRYRKKSMKEIRSAVDDDF